MISELLFCLRVEDMVNLLFNCISNHLTYE